MLLLREMRARSCQDGWALHVTVWLENTLLLATSIQVGKQWLTPFMIGYTMSSFVTGQPVVASATGAFVAGEPHTSLTKSTELDTIPMADPLTINGSWDSQGVEVVVDTPHMTHAELQAKYPDAQPRDTPTPSPLEPEKAPSTVEQVKTRNLESDLEKSIEGAELLEIDADDMVSAKNALKAFLAARPFFQYLQKARPETLDGLTELKGLDNSERKAALTLLTSEKASGSEGTGVPTAPPPVPTKDLTSSVKASGSEGTGVPTAPPPVPTEDHTSAEGPELEPQPDLVEKKCGNKPDRFYWVLLGPTLHAIECYCHRGSAPFQMSIKYVYL